MFFLFLLDVCPCSSRYISIHFLIVILQIYVIIDQSWSCIIVHDDDDDDEPRLSLLIQFFFLHASLSCSSSFIDNEMTRSQRNEFVEGWEKKKHWNQSTLQGKNLSSRIYTVCSCQKSQLNQSRFSVSLFFDPSRNHFPLVITDILFPFLINLSRSEK